MGTRKTAIVLWLGVAIMVIAVCFAGCDCDKPTGPKPEELKDYAVYFWDEASTRKLFVYHPTTKVIDSFDLAYTPVEGVTVSADGRRLYLADRNAVVVLDADSLQLVDEFAAAPEWPIAVSPDNRYMAIMGDDLQIFRTSDCSLVFGDTDITENGWFSWDSKHFYCAGGWSPGVPGYVYTMDLSDSTFPVLRRPFAHAGVVHVVPTIDESKWLLYMNPSGLYTSAFEVYDVALDSIIFSDVLVPGSGQIVITPDGRYAMYGNPGTIMMGPPAPSEFTIFDIERNEISEVVQTKGFVDGLTPLFFPVESMAITPDGRWLVALNGVAPHQLLLYDIERRCFADYIFLGNDKFLMNLTVQNAR